MGFTERPIQEFLQSGEAEDRIGLDVAVPHRHGAAVGKNSDQ